MDADQRPKDLGPAPPRGGSALAQRGSALARLGRRSALGGIIVAAFALGGGAYAALGPTGGQIHACVGKGGVLSVSASGRCRRGQHALIWNRMGAAGASGVAGAQGPAGAQGTAGTPGSAGAPGDPGAAGMAKAYGYVDDTGELVTGRSSNVTGVSIVGSGVYCVTVSGATPATDPATATADFSNDDTTSAQFTHVEWESQSPNCSPSQYEFVTWLVNPTAAHFVTNHPAGFSFVIA